MKRRPHMLAEHEVQVFFGGFGESLAADPAADEMDQSVDAAKFGRDSLSRGADCLSIPQVNNGGKESLIGQIQVAGQGIQFVLIVIQQRKRMTAVREGLRGFVSQYTRCTSNNYGSCFRVRERTIHPVR
jgi:hypothetical protein